MNISRDSLQSLAFYIEKNGFEVLNCLSDKELKKPLIYKDWQGTGGKLGYESLAKRYNMSVSQIRTICKAFKKPVKS